MRAKASWMLGATLSLCATAATAQSFPCASVAPEVRERVREAGACRDARPDHASPKDAASSVVTVILSDGTAVRVPREIGSNIRDERKRAATNRTATAASGSAHSGPADSGDPTNARRTPKVPDVIGRSYDEAGRALAEFKVDRIETANSASGDVLAQEPAPATPMLPGSTVSLQVSGGSLAGAPDTTPVTTAPIAAAALSTPASATDSTAASAPAPLPASERTAPPEPRGFPIAFSANAALALGAGVLLGLFFGALSMRQWLLRRELTVDEKATPPTLYRHQRPAESGTGDISVTGAAPEIRFAARLDPGETTIAFARLSDGDEVAFEHSREHA